MDYIKEFKSIENARIDDIKVGSCCHDYRANFSITFSGNGWAQSAVLPFDIKVVDKLIDICGVSDLYSCKNKLVRIAFRSASLSPIDALFHIIDNEKNLEIRSSK